MIKKPGDIRYLKVTATEVFPPRKLTTFCLTNHPKPAPQASRLRDTRTVLQQTLKLLLIVIMALFHTHTNTEWKP